jgi:hypothetical protein
MADRSPGHSHQFTIADADAVATLVARLQHPQGSSRIDVRRLRSAMDRAARAYGGTRQKTRQAFLHGLLTGYGIALKCR